jgi:hypothetical protein
LAGLGVVGVQAHLCDPLSSGRAIKSWRRRMVVKFQITINPWCWASVNISAD